MSARVPMRDLPACAMIGAARALPARRKEIR
jgi:hypothetical protein